MDWFSVPFRLRLLETFDEAFIKFEFFFEWLHCLEIETSARGAITRGYSSKQG